MIESIGGRGVSLRMGAYRFAEQWPYLRYLGMGFWWAWIWLCYSSTSLFQLWIEGDFAFYVGFMYLCSTPAIAIACVLAAVFWRKATRLLQESRAVVSFGAVASVGTLLVALSQWLGGIPIFVAGGVLTGAGTSMLCLKTGSTFGTLGRREVLTAGCVSLMMASFLYFMGIGLPCAWRPFFVAALPIASAFLYIMPSDDPVSSEGLVQNRRGGGVGMKAFVCLVVASVMVAATAGFAKGLVAVGGSSESFDQLGSVSTFGIFLGVLAFSFLVNCADVVKVTRAAYATLIFFGVLVVLSSSFDGDLGILAVGKDLLWMLFTCLMAYMVFRFGFSPVRAFGLGQAAHLVASALFWWFGMLASESIRSASAHIVITTALILAIVIVFAFVFTDSDLRFMLSWRPGEPARTSKSAENEAGLPLSCASRSVDRRTMSNDGAGSVLQVAEAPACASSYAPQRELGLHERIMRIDDRFGISAREAEVMELFACGRSANWIAEELVISNNTVRSHLRSIYTKLDVHSRQELLDFLSTVPSHSDSDIVK